MKLGELVLVWVAGLWTVLVSVVLLAFGLIGEQISFSYLAGLLFLASLPVWILCGLIWLTVYRRKLNAWNTNADLRAPDTHSLAPELVFPMKEVSTLAEQTMAGTYWDPEIVKAHFLPNELETFSANKATLEDIRRVISRIVEALPSANENEKFELRSVLSRFYDDLQSALESHNKTSDQMAFNESIWKPYFVNLIDDSLEKASFFRDGIKMVRPLAFVWDLESMLWRLGWDRELFKQTFSKKQIERFLKYFRKLDGKAYQLRLTHGGYLPMSVAIPFRSVVDLLDRARSKRLENIAEPLMFYGLGLPVLGLMLISPFIVLALVLAYVGYWIKSSGTKTVLLPCS